MPAYALSMAKLRKPEEETRVRGSVGSTATSPPLCTPIESTWSMAGVGDGGPTETRSRFHADGHAVVGAARRGSAWVALD